MQRAMTVADSLVEGRRERLRQFVPETFEAGRIEAVGHAVAEGPWAPHLQPQ